MQNKISVDFGYPFCQLSFAFFCRGIVYDYLYRCTLASYTTHLPCESILFGRSGGLLQADIMPPFEYVSLPNLFSVSVFGFAVRLAKLSLPFYKIKNTKTIRLLLKVGLLDIEKTREGNYTGSVILFAIRRCYYELRVFFYCQYYRNNNIYFT